MSRKTLAQLLKDGTEILKESEIEEAGLDAWLLLEYETGKNRAYFYAHSEEEAEEAVIRGYEEKIQKRASHIPLQHITHQGFFMGYEFFVDEHVLVPRQDTETLVEEALRLLQEKESPAILDMCTGSGCILISLLLEKAGSTGTGADLSPETLLVAKRNAERLQVTDRADFVESNLFSADYFQERDGKEGPKYDMLISNPPYIPSAEIEELMEEVRLHDPRMALDGKEDGLYFYREITGNAGRYLKPGGWLLYEIGCSQGNDVKEIMEAAGYQDVRILKDLAGLDRVAAGRRP